MTPPRDTCEYFAVAAGDETLGRPRPVRSGPSTTGTARGDRRSGAPAVLRASYRIQGVVSDHPDLRAALAMGLGGGLRTFAPAVALAVHGRGPFVGRGRFIVFGAAAVELIADKDPRMPSRWSPRGMSLRLVFSATGGRVLGRGPGAAIAMAAALGAAFAGSRLRVKVHKRGRQLAAAVTEDALSYSLVLLATSSLQ